MSYLIFITIIVNLAICIPFTKKNSKIRSILHIALFLTIITGIIIFTVQHFKIVLSVLGFIFLVVLAALSQDDTNTSRKSKTITNKSYQNSSQNTQSSSASVLGNFVIIFKINPSHLIEQKEFKCIPNSLSFKCGSMSELEMYKNSHVYYSSKEINYGRRIEYNYGSYYEIDNRFEFEELNIPYISQNSYYDRA